MCFLLLHSVFSIAPLNLLWVFVTLTQVFSSTYAYTVYFDSFGDCNRRDAFIVDDEEYTVLSQGGDHVTQNCKLSFKAFKQDEELCLKFLSFRIDDCSVRFYVYDKSSPSGSYSHMFSCDDEPKNLCSTGRYLTLKLYRQNINTRRQYRFELVVKEKSQSEAFLDGGFDAFVMSIGLIIAIIVGVVVLIAVTAVVMVCCCCKKKRTSKRGANRHKQGSEAEPFRPQAPPLQPTAPPLTDQVYQPSVQPGFEQLQGYQAQTGHIGYPPPPPPLEQPPAYSVNPPQYIQQT